MGYRCWWPLCCRCLALLCWARCAESVGVDRPDDLQLSRLSPLYRERLGSAGVRFERFCSKRNVRLVDVLSSTVLLCPLLVSFIQVLHDTSAHDIGRDGTTHFVRSSPKQVMSDGMVSRPTTASPCQAKTRGSELKGRGAKQHSSVLNETPTHANKLIRCPRVRISKASVCVINCKTNKRTSLSFPQRVMPWVTF